MNCNLLLVIIIVACICAQPLSGKPLNVRSDSSFMLYSSNVNDSFRIFISLPENYSEKKHYPVVYLTDANFNFDIMSAIAHTQARFGLLPPVIIAGIGYKNDETMDKLRDRDFTYPLAPASDSFEISGGADKFFHFTKDELIPYMDNHYSTDKNKRILAGHSLGGYFTLYALQQYAQGNDNSFYGYVAASPSLEYSHDYLPKQFENTPVKPAGNSKPLLYLTLGGMEDAEAIADGEPARSDTLFQSLNHTLRAKYSPYMLSQSEVYAAFGHMDMPVPSFTKGLQWMLNR
jgi:predicted alpha/beta superfamily hydrolase